MDCLWPEAGCPLQLHAFYCQKSKSGAFTSRGLSFRDGRGLAKCPGDGGNTPEVVCQLGFQRNMMSSLLQLERTCNAMERWFEVMSTLLTNDVEDVSEDACFFRLQDRVWIPTLIAQFEFSLSRSIRRGN